VQQQHFQVLELRKAIVFFLFLVKIVFNHKPVPPTATAVAIARFSSK
jgi:hypothetical protein